MIVDISEIFKRNYSRIDFTIMIPDAFEKIKASDANFESSVSNTLQPLKLVYCHNVSTRTLAVIFLHTHVKDQEYTGDEERAKLHEELFKEIFEFNSVVVHTNIGKDKIMKVLAELYSEAQNKAADEILLIAIINIGYNLRVQTL